jgi:hypothetical protein
MKRCLLALACVAALSGSALAQSFTYTGLEGLLYSGMTPQQQGVYNSIQVYMNFSTQVVTAAAYSSAQKKLQNGDILTSFDNTLLARGPFAVTTGNQAFVPIGGTTSTTTP